MKRAVLKGATPRVALKPKKRRREVIEDNFPSPRDHVEEALQFVGQGILTNDAFMLIQQLADHLEWLAKGYGLWRFDE